MADRKGMLDYAVTCLRPKTVARDGKSNITPDTMRELEQRKTLQRERIRKLLESRRRKSA